MAKKEKSKERDRREWMEDHIQELETANEDLISRLKDIEWRCSSPGGAEDYFRPKPQADLDCRKEILSVLNSIARTFDETDDPKAADYVREYAAAVKKAPPWKEAAPPTTRVNV